MSILDAARSDDRRKALIAARDALAAAMDVAEPNVLAQLAGQFRSTLAELAALPSDEKVSKRDELAARRAGRQSAAAAERAAVKSS